MKPPAPKEGHDATEANPKANENAANSNPSHHAGHHFDGNSSYPIVLNCSLLMLGPGSSRVPILHLIGEQLPTKIMIESRETAPEITPCGCALKPNVAEKV
jgi:hypothetical protein